MRVFIELFAIRRRKDGSVGREVKEMMSKGVVKIPQDLKASTTRSHDEGSTLEPSQNKLFAGNTFADQRRPFSTRRRGYATLASVARTIAAPSPYSWQAESVEYPGCK